MKDNISPERVTNQSTSPLSNRGPTNIEAKNTWDVSGVISERALSLESLNCIVQ